MQGKFAEMEHGIWEKAYGKGRDFSAKNLEAIAKEAGLNIDKYKADKDGACKASIKKDQADLSAVGTTGTPAFYINGRFLSGAQPIDNFKKIIDAELKKANDRIGKGEATVSDYYDKFVFKKGLKKLATKK